MATTRTVLGERVGAATVDVFASAELADVIDAVYAHGRTIDGLIDVLNALTSAHFWSRSFAADDAKTLRFAVEGVLRGSKGASLNELEVALTFFAPQLLDRSSKKASAAAASQLRFVWQCLVDSVENDAADVAALSAGCVRVLNCIGRLKTSDAVVIEQVVWLASAVARRLAHIGFAGPAVHQQVRSVLLQPAAPADLLAAVAASSNASASTTTAQQRQQQVQGEAAVVLLLLLCGPRHHVNFTRMTLPLLVKRAGATEFGAHACASCLVATSDAANTVPQAATVDSFAQVAATEQMAAVLAACGAGPIEKSLADELVAAVLQAASAASDASVNKAALQRSQKALKGIKTVAVPRDNKASGRVPSPVAAYSGKQAAPAATAGYRAPLARNAAQQHAADPERMSIPFVFLMLAVTGAALWTISMALRTPDRVWRVLLDLGLPVEQMQRLRATIEGLVAHFAPAAARRK